MRLTLRERVFGNTEERTLTKQDIPPAMLSLLPSGPVTPTNATSIADAYACVRALGDAAASVPLVPYRRTAEGRERVEGGKLSELLARPAPGSTQSVLIGQLMAHLQLHGNAFIGKFREAGEIVQLAALAPDRIQVEVKAGKPVYTLTAPRGRRSTHSVEDIVHIRGITTDGMLGLSPVKQAKTVLNLSDQLAEHASTFFANSARPAGILRGPFGDEAAVEAMRDEWDTHLRGTENAHRIAMVSGDVSFEALGMPLDDAQFLEQRKLSAVEVARIFRVPPWMIGADSGESLTYSNVESQALSFVTYSLRPWLVAIEQAISNDADLCSQRQYVEFLLDALLRADSKTRSEVFTKALDPITGWMTREEVRRLENLPPEPAERPRPERIPATTNGAGNPENVEVG